MSLVQRLGVAMVVVGLLAGSAGAIGYGHVRDGWAYGFGIGIGWMQLSATDITQAPPLELSSDWESDIAGGVRVSFSPSDQFAYGIEFSGWTDYTYWGENDDQIKTTAFWILLQGHYFPRGQGFFVRGGLGLGSLGLKITHPAAIISQTQNGVGWGLGAGYELRVAPTLALGVAYDYRSVNVGSVTSVLDDVSTVTQSATLTFTWYRD